MLIMDWKIFACVQLVARFNVPTRFNEPRHEKAKKCGCSSRKDQDQSRHQLSPIRVFAVLMEKAWVFSYQLSAQWRESTISVRVGQKIRPKDRRLASRGLTYGDIEGPIFLSYPHTNNGFFFLLTTVFIYSFKKKLSEVP